MQDTNKYLIEQDLTYKIRSIFIRVSQKYGYSYKEKVYQKILVNEFNQNKVIFKNKPKLIIKDVKEDLILGTYIPDFIVENKVIIEVKALNSINQIHIDQLVRYLKFMKYEVGLLVNFGKPKAEIIRRIYTNDKK